MQARERRAVEEMIEAPAGQQDTLSQSMGQPGLGLDHERASGRDSTRYEHVRPTFFPCEHECFRLIHRSGSARRSLAPRSPNRIPERWVGRAVRPASRCRRRRGGRERRRRGADGSSGGFGLAAGFGEGLGGASCELAHPRRLPSPLHVDMWTGRAHIWSL